MKRILAFLNLPQHFLALKPGMVLAIGFAIGLGLCLLSYVLGVGTFQAEITVYEGGQHWLRTLSLGYLTQLNYGIWYLTFGPFLLMVFSFCYRSLLCASGRFPSVTKSFPAAVSRWPMSLFGLLCVCYFVGSNLFVELNQYSKLGLGWVQAESIERLAGRLPANLSHAGKATGSFLMEDPERPDLVQRTAIDSVVLNDVRGLKVRSHSLMVVFVMLAKTWAGFWEAIACYLAGLAIIWGTIIFPLVKRRRKNQGTLYNHKWAQAPATYFFMAGLLVNLFCVFRYYQNAIKGSFGRWDQYIAVIVTSPGVAFFFVFFAIMARIHTLPFRTDEKLTSKPVMLFGLAWFASLLFVVSLFIDYLSPQTTGLIAFVFLPVIKLLRWIVQPMSYFT